MKKLFFRVLFSLFGYCSHFFVYCSFRFLFSQSISILFTEYKPTLGENLAQYNDPNFTNDAMEFVNFHDIVTSVTASYDEQVLFCQMDGENCLVEDSWKFIKSRNAVCLEFTPSRRKMFTPLQHLRIIFGNKKFSLLHFLIGLLRIFN